MSSLPGVGTSRVADFGDLCPVARSHKFIPIIQKYPSLPKDTLLSSGSKRGLRGIILECYYSVTEGCTTTFLSRAAHTHFQRQQLPDQPLGGSQAKRANDVSGDYKSGTLCLSLMAWDISVIFSTLSLGESRAIHTTMDIVRMVGTLATSHHSTQHKI